MSVETPVARDRSCCAPGRAPATPGTTATPKTATSETVTRPTTLTDSGAATDSGATAAAAAAAAAAEAYRTRCELPGGTYRMGGEDRDANPGDAEGPVREVAVAAFAVDAYAVTNARFAAFVAATGHRTDAEQFGWSYVFAKFLPGRLRKISPRPDATPWWCGVEGARWDAPEGPGSGLEGRWDHPVCHVSWEDARAFCAWDGGRLPSEPEWEYAARGGLDQARYPWGDELTPGGEHRCNIWQGPFPARNTAEDGWAGTAPVHAFPPNGFGLFNTAGNVWEWTADAWGPHSPGLRAMRGGSYLCHASYCNRYRVAARTANTPDSTAGNVGFRVVHAPTACHNTVFT